MEDLLGGVEQEDLTFAQRGETYETLLKVLKNINANPTEQKFRTLKKDNKLIAEKLCRSACACSVLLALGFEDETASYRLPPDADLEPLGESVALLECILASRESSEAAPPPAAAPAAVQEPRLAAAPSAGSPTAPGNMRGFVRRSDEERRREEQARELQAVRAAQRAHFGDGGGAAAALRDAAPAAAPAPAQAAAGQADSKKPVKSAFDFESRQKRDQQHQQAESSLEELRRQQREKFKQFEADPTARQAAAYQQPASVSAGGKAEQSWGDWFGGMFGGSSSGSGGGGGSRPSNERRGPNMKTINDLPKPVQRG